jgi:putative RecB family exonuclease
MMPLKISASAIKAYEQCPYRYAKDYVDRLPQNEREPVFHLAFGNTVHRTIAKFILAGGWVKVPHLQLVQMLHEHWDDSLLETKSRRLKEFQRAKAMIDGFYFRRYPRDVTTELGVERYVRWSQPRNGILATGKLDRVCLVGGDTLEVIDYKTGKLSIEPGDLVNDLQAVFYRTLAADVFQELSPRSVKVTFFYLGEGHPMSVELSRDDLIDRWRHVQQIAEQIRKARRNHEAGLPLREAFPVSRGLQCQGCPMQKHCDGLEVPHVMG